MRSKEKFEVGQRVWLDRGLLTVPGKIIKLGPFTLMEEQYGEEFAMIRDVDGLVYIRRLEDIEPIENSGPKRRAEFLEAVASILREYGVDDSERVPILIREAETETLTNVHAELTALADAVEEELVFREEKVGGEN